MKLISCKNRQCHRGIVGWGERERERGRERVYEYQEALHCPIMLVFLSDYPDPPSPLFAFFLSLSFCRPFSICSGVRFFFQSLNLSASVLPPLEPRFRLVSVTVEELGSICISNWSIVPVIVDGDPATWANGNGSSVPRFGESTS